MKEDKSLHKKTIFLSIVAFLFVLGLVAYSFAYYYFTAKGVTENKIESCSLDMDIIDADSFDLVASYPIDDSEVEDYDPYTITIKNNNSKCKNLYYYINGTNYCDSCLLDNNNNCIVGEKTINCNDNYRIDPQFIRYKITNKTTGKSITGYNPEKMYIFGSFLTSGTDNYDVRMWISNKATNEDIYVYDGGSQVLDEDGKNVTKSYVSQLETQITTTMEEQNLAEIDERYLALQSDGSYGNTMSWVKLYRDKSVLVKQAWKDKTRYRVSYSMKGPVGNNKRIYLTFVYTDGTSNYAGSVTADGEWHETSGISTNGKTIDYISCTYYSSTGITTSNTVFVKNLVITEVR